MTSVQPPLLDFQHVSVVRGKRKILKDLSLQIGMGDHIALLGPNGSGKSTLIKMITRELYPLQNPRSSFKMFGESFWDVSQLRRRLGIVSTDTRPFQERGVIGEEAVLSGFFSSVGLWPVHRITSLHRRKTHQVMRFLELSGLAKRSLAEMSSGEAQRFLIGRALVHDPSALILDEPTNSLDVRAAGEFRRLLSKIARSGKTVILVTHHIEDIIPEIKRVILLKDGRVARDGPIHSTLTSAWLSLVFRSSLTVGQRNGHYHMRINSRPLAKQSAHLQSLRAIKHP